MPSRQPTSSSKATSDAASEISASVRRGQQSHRDAVLWFLVVAQTLGAAPILLDRRRRTSHGWRQDQSYQWRRERWNGAILTGDAPTRDGEAGEQRRIVWVCKGIAETRLALELSRRLDAESGASKHHFALIDFPSVQNAQILPPDAWTSAFPFDYGPSVSGWLGRVKPQLVVAVEQIWHLHLARTCRAHGIPLVAMHVQTRPGWGGASPLEKWLKCRTLEGFCALGFRSQGQADFWKPFVPVENAIAVTGTLKFPLALPTLAPERQKTLEAWLEQSASRPIIAAGSIEPKEESVIWDAFDQLRAQTSASRPVLLLAPRHLDRAEALESAAQSHGYSVSRRSTFSGTPNPEADVLLLDTMGELALAYRACRAAFVGGTFVGNGHNVFEPLASGVPVAYGPRRGIFGLEQEQCEASEVGWRVNDAAELAAFWKRAIEDANWQAAFAARLPDFSAQARAGWTQTLGFLRSCVEAVEKS